jgi:hypothetical protein
MKNKGFAVAAQLNVAFDRKSAGDRGFRRRDSVLDDALGLVVEAAMGDWTPHKPSGSVYFHSSLAFVGKAADSGAISVSFTPDKPAFAVSSPLAARLRRSETAAAAHLRYVPHELEQAQR